MTDPLRPVDTDNYPASEAEDDYSPAVIGLLLAGVSGFLVGCVVYRLVELWVAR